jgi:hypothetical protein
MFNIVQTHILSYWNMFISATCIFYVINLLVEKMCQYQQETFFKVTFRYAVNPSPDDNSHLTQGS